MVVWSFVGFCLLQTIWAGLPQTTEYISGLQTSCKTMGTVEEGKPTVIYFNLTSDPMEGKLNYAYICLIRGQDAADSKNGEAEKLPACTGDRILSGELKVPRNRLTYSVKSGYKFVGTVDNQLTLVIENASRHQSGEYFVEDSSGSPRLTCFLNVTGATEISGPGEDREEKPTQKSMQDTGATEISGPGEDREEKPTQKSVQDTDGTRWIGLWVFLGVILMLQFVSILGIWCQRDNKKFIQTVVQIIKSIRDDNEGRATQHPRTNDESSVDGNTLPIDMGYEGRSRKNQSPQEANDDAATDSILNEEMPVDVEAQNPQQQPEQRPLLQVPVPVSDDQSCVYAESTN